MVFSWKGEDVPVWDYKDHCAREASRYMKHIQDDHRKHHTLNNCTKQSFLLKKLSQITKMRPLSHYTVLYKGIGHIYIYIYIYIYI